MRRIVLIVVGTMLLAGVAVSEEPEQTVPSTVEDGARTFREGGREIGEGFRGIGRATKKMFTGRRSREDFEEAGKIGDGFRDLGRGTAGVGRGVGRDIKQGFKGNRDTNEE